LTAESPRRPSGRPYPDGVSNLAGSRINVRVPKTAELVAARIRRQIVTGELREGDALPSETALMETFSISRPTMREAYRILESEGLITVRRGAHGGARVLEPTADGVARAAGLVLQHRGATIADVLEARVYIEAPAARILAARRDRVSIAERLQQNLDAWEGEPETFAEFNSLMLELTDNETLWLVATMLESVTSAAAAAYVQRPHPVSDERLARRAEKGRQKVIDLIRAGDGDGAEEAWRIHLEDNARVLAEGLGGSIVDLFSD
jgi:DNA-binding FadR family transcriptional regulator